MSINPAEAIHLAHAVSELREWWEQPHDLMGKAVRTVAGPVAFSRLPERFRTGEVSEAALLESRRVRASLSSGGQHRSRIAAFLPARFAYECSLEASRSDDSAFVLAHSEQAGAESLESYALSVRSAQEGGALSPGVVLGREGMTGKFDQHVANGSTLRCTDGYCDVDGRRYRTLAASSATESAGTPSEIDAVVEALRVDQRGQPELRRVVPDLSCTVPNDWWVTETLSMLTPDPGAFATVTSQPVDSGVSVLEAAELHAAELRALSGYVEVSTDAARLLGGRDGVRRLFNWTPAGGTRVDALAFYYVEAGRSYCVLEVVAAGSPVSSALAQVVSRVVLV